MNLRDIDMNLLVIFHQLLLDRNVSAAADKLDLTQPAVSNALKRLRTLLKDELFTRTSRGMEPTPFAMQLSEPVGYALNALQNALSQCSDFDPLTSTRTFTLAMSDIGDVYFMPPLMETLARVAPHIRLSTLRPHSGNLKEDMEAGSVDLAVGLLPNLQAGFFQRRLFRHPYVCLFRKEHPLASKKKMSLKDFCSYQHVGIASPNTGHSEVDLWLERLGIQRDIRLVVPHFIAVGHILQTTDLVATVPERFAARQHKPLGLMSSPHPADLPEIAVNLFWHARFNRDPAIMWLRQLIFDMFADA